MKLALIDLVQSQQSITLSGNDPYKLERDSDNS